MPDPSPAATIRAALEYVIDRSVESCLHEDCGDCATCRARAALAVLDGAEVWWRGDVPRPKATLWQRAKPIAHDSPYWRRVLVLPEPEGDKEDREG